MPRLYTQGMVAHIVEGRDRAWRVVETHDDLTPDLAWGDTLVCSHLTHEEAAAMCTTTGTVGQLTFDFDDT